MRLFAIASSVCLAAARARWLLCTGLLLSLCYSPWSLADTPKIILINSSDAQPYRLAAAAVKKHLLARGVLAHYELQQLPLAQANAELQLVPGSFIVTLGSAAADHVIQQVQGVPVINSFITYSAYEAIHTAAPNDQAFSGVFMDQPLTRLIALASLLKQKQQPYTIGLLSQTEQADQPLLSAASSSELVIHSAKLLLDKNPIKQIEPLMKHSDVVIVRPNTSLFNRLVAKLVLQLSMRYQTPVIGFSEKYARAGALLSLYASPDNIGQDTAQLISEWLDSAGLNGQPKILPAARYGQQFSVVINPHIAKKMAMTTLDADQLSLALQHSEANNNVD